MTNKPSSTDIFRLLQERFPLEKFLVVPECKTASTWFSPRCSRFDAWILARSWRHPRFIGCEIKISRQDFLNDNKWPDYLPFCSEFYFVVSHEIVDSAEVPEQAGLMEASKNCKKLIVKKRPLRGTSRSPGLC